MQDSRRYRLASAATVVAHVLFILAGELWGLFQFNVGLEVPEFEFEFETVELIDPDQLQGDEPTPAQAPPEIVPPPEVPPEPEGEGPKEEEPPPEEKEPKKFGDKNSKVDKLGPTNSTFYMLLATKKVARLPFASEAAEIMAPLPDFEFIIQGGGFHPFRDFDYLVLASPDIRDMTQTFLAVSYKMPRQELKAGLGRAAADRGEVLTWEDRDGVEMANPRPADESKLDHDPRWFVIVDDKVAVYVREEFLPQILTGPDASKGKTAGNFVANIAKMRRFTRQEPRAGLQLVMKDMRSALKNAKGLPFEFPDDLEVMAEASKNPELVIKLGFEEADHAKEAEKFWTKDLKAIIDGDLKIKFLAGSYYASTTVERDDKSLILRNRFDSDQARTILQLIGDGSRKMMKKSHKDMAAARKRREEMWKARNNGKLLPSEVLAKDAAQAEGASPEPLPPSDDADPSGAPAPSDPPETPSEPEPAPAPAEAGDEN